MIDRKIHNDKFDFAFEDFQEFDEKCFESLSDEVVVDKTDFSPNINEARLFSASGSGSSRVGVYDFVDGVDTGVNLTLLRDKGADVTEIDRAMKVLQFKADDEIKNAKKQIDEEAQLLNDKLVQSQNSSDSSASDS